MKNKTLLIDQGNSRIKYALLDEQENEIAPCEINYLNIRRNEIDKVVIASVKGNADELISELKSFLPQASYQVLATQKAVSGVTVAYADETRLGVDRWLAMVTAFNQVKRNCVVLDFGTALTIDAVNNEGLHLGGWIIAGINTSLNALLQGTSEIKIEDDVQYRLALGHSTEECVANGALVNQLLPLIYAIKHVQTNNHFDGKLIPCFLTGGDSEMYLAAIMSLLDTFQLNEIVTIKHEPLLVFSGMQQIIADETDKNKKN